MCLQSLENFGSKSQPDYPLNCLRKLAIQGSLMQPKIKRFIERAAIKHLFHVYQ